MYSTYSPMMCASERQTHHRSHASSLARRMPTRLSANCTDPQRMHTCPPLLSGRLAGAEGTMGKEKLERAGKYRTIQAHYIGRRPDEHLLLLTTPAEGDTAEL